MTNIDTSNRATLMPVCILAIIKLYPVDLKSKLKISEGRNWRERGGKTYEKKHDSRNVGKV